MRRLLLLLPLLVACGTLLGTSEDDPPVTTPLTQDASSDGGASSGSDAGGMIVVDAETFDGADANCAFDVITLPRTELSDGEYQGQGISLNGCPFELSLRFTRVVENPATSTFLRLKNFNGGPSIALATSGKSLRLRVSASENAISEYSTAGVPHKIVIRSGAERVTLKFDDEPEVRAEPDGVLNPTEISFGDVDQLMDSVDNALVVEDLVLRPQ